MSPLFGKQAAKLFLEKEYEELERQRQLLKTQEERMQRDVAAERERAMAEVQQKIDWFDAHKRTERNHLEYEREKAHAEIERAKHIEGLIEKERQIIAKLVEDALVAAPYIADIYSDYLYAHDLRIADLLASKSHPALKAADTVREYAKSRKDAEQQLCLLKYKLSVFEHFFPWVNDYDDLTVSELCKIKSADSSAEDSDDPVKQYVSPSEYLSLTNVQRNQLALDRYLASHKKTKWEIGRDYELYVGHLFARDGYHVEYTGSLFRFDDLGRDLVVRKGKRILIVQCKYWSKEKEIHEKHIFQLFGTSICYQIDHPDCQVSCVLVTNTVCSATARSFAAKMSVALKENVELGDFPRIKCNISDSGERIYHLPMDQQYDNVVIDKPGEFFAMTVQEADNRGFRRAYRWHGA